MVTVENLSGGICESPSSLNTRKIPAAAASRTAWQLMALRRLDNPEARMLAFLSLLCCRIPSIGTPNNRSLSRDATIMSRAQRKTTNSLLKDDDSTVFCPFEYQMIGAFCA